MSAPDDVDCDPQTPVDPETKRHLARVLRAKLRSMSGISSAVDDLCSDLELTPKDLPMFTIIDPDSPTSPQTSPQFPIAPRSKRNMWCVATV